MAENSVACFCVLWVLALSSIAGATDDETCFAKGDHGCNRDVSGSKLLQRRTEINRTRELVALAKDTRVHGGRGGEVDRRPRRPPRGEPLRILRAQTEEDSSAGASQGSDLLRREGLAGEALGEGRRAEELVEEAEGRGAVDPANALEVIRENAEHMTPEEALRNGVLTTAETIRALTGGNAEDEDCRPGTNGTPCFQGDMVPVNDEQFALFKMMAQLGVKRSHRKHAGTLWTEGNVRYCFATEVSQRMRRLMQVAFNSIARAVPCLTFIDVGNPKNYSGSDSREQRACGVTPAIFVQSTTGGCWSHVGMLSQSQLHANGIAAGYLNMAEYGCYSLGTAIHEALHALGLGHEPPRRRRGAGAGAGGAGGGGQDGASSAPDALSIMRYGGASGAPSGAAEEEAAWGLGGGVHDGELRQRVGMTSSDAEELALMYRGEKASCAARSRDEGTGCSDTGSTDCESLASCGGESSMDDCCACGAGIEYQCWSGAVCRKVDALPVDFVKGHADCMIDRSAWFPGYGCVIQNLCSIAFTIRCSNSPGYFYDHPANSSYYVSPFSQICKENSRCRVVEQRLQ